LKKSETLGEPPVRLLSALTGQWTVNFVASNGDMVRELAAQFLTLAEMQGSAVWRLVGQNLMGTSLLHTGHIAQSRVHFDEGAKLYDPVTFGDDLNRSEHAPLRHAAPISTLIYRSWAMWMLGYPEAAIADIARALSDAREADHAATMMYALTHAAVAHILCKDYAAANAEANELIELAGEKGALYWKAAGIAVKGCVLALTDKVEDAIQMIGSGLATYRSTGSTNYIPWWSSFLARSYAQLGEFDEACRCIAEAIAAVKTTKITLFEADISCMAGDIALMLPEPASGKAEAYFNRALDVARQQQAKSWELRAAMSMARLWRDQGKRDEARELLAPVYGWFTEGFDTHDLKEAKALLNELAA
jgi:predicted ATPase